MEPYYDTGLGCEVTDRGHRQRLMRERNLEEIGDTRIDDIRVTEPEKSFGTEEQFHDVWNEVVKKE